MRDFEEKINYTYYLMNGKGERRMFGETIQELLNLRGLSQKQFAAMLKIPYTTVNGYVNNKREPDYKTLLDIAELLNVSADYLLGNSPQEEPQTAAEIALLSSFRELSAEQRELIEVQMETMKKQNAHRILNIK